MTKPAYSSIKVHKILYLRIKIKIIKYIFIKKKIKILFFEIISVLN